MKAMRRITTILLVIGTVLSFTACGGSEKTVTLSGDATDQLGGIPATDTWTLTAKGDIVQTVNEVFEIDLSEYDEDMRETFISTIREILVEPAQAIEGVTCSDRSEDTTYIIDLTVDCTGDAVKAAVDAGILTVDGGADQISLKQTQAGLEAQGYEVVE